MQRIGEIWRRGFGGKVMVGCGGCLSIIVLLGICGGIVTALSGGKSSTTANTGGAAPVAVVAPTTAATPTTAAAAADVPPTATIPQAPTEAPAPTAEPTAAPTAEPTVAPTVATLPKIGEDVKIGDVRWKFLEVKDEGNTLKADNEFIKPKTTAGKWLRVKFEIENQSTDTLNFTGVDLKDSKGRTFKPSTDAIMYMPEETQCVFAQLSANVPKTCETMYELPADAAGLQAVIGDLKLFGATDGAVDLGQ